MRIVLGSGCCLLACAGLMGPSAEKADDDVFGMGPPVPVAHQVVPTGVSPMSDLAGQLIHRDETVSDASSEMGVVREWTATVDRRLGDLVPDASHPEDVQFIPLRLGPEREVLMEVRRFREVAPGEGVYIGAVAGKAYSTAVFSYVGEAFAGFVTLYDERRSFQITANEDGLMRVTELDLDASPGCAPPLLTQST